MKNTKILFGLLAALATAFYMGCKCPECPAQNNIVTNDVDTVSFSIVTNDVDTVSFQMVAPIVTRDGKVEKASIVIDNVDMARLIMGKADTSKYNIILNQQKPQRDTTLQQQQ